jgi:hypothetical protein
MSAFAYRSIIGETCFHQIADSPPTGGPKVKPCRIGCGQDSLVDPKNHGCCDKDRGREGASTSIMTLGKMIYERIDRSAWR